MKPMIDRHNYEAYYLDYLEGNLDVATSELLEIFLSEHPELAIDGDLPQLQPDMRIDSSFRLSLKKEAAEEITAENIDYFLIAELEQQLSSAQQAKLDAFIALHPEFEKERRIVQSLVLEAGAEQFAHKESLKKGARIIPLWLKMAAAAAILLLFTLPFLRFGETAGSGSGTQFQTAHSDGRHPQKTRGTHPQSEKEKRSPVPAHIQNQQSEYVAQQSDEPVIVGPRTHGEKPAANHPPKERRKHNTAVSELPAKMIRSSTPDLAVTDPKEEAIPALAVASVAHEDSKMENAIPVITRGVSEVFNTPVEVKTEKSAGRKGKGFYVRIGNVEVSRSASL